MEWVGLKTYKKLADMWNSMTNFNHRQVEKIKTTVITYILSRVVDKAVVCDKKAQVLGLAVAGCVHMQLITL
jgi:hypothetical protein